MQRTTLNSTLVKSAGYDSVSKTLEVELPDSVYLYFNIPPAMYEGLMSAKSAGQYFNLNIRSQSHRKLA